MLLKSVLVLLFVAQCKTQEYDEIVMPEMGVALKKSGMIASYKEVDTIGLQVTVKKPHVKKPQMISDTENVLEALVKTNPERDFHENRRCVDLWNYYQKTWEDNLYKTSHSCSAIMDENKNARNERSAAEDNTNKIVHNEVYFKQALAQQVTENARVTWTLEAFESYLNREMAMSTCELDMQALNADFMHDINNFVQRIRQLLLVVKTGKSDVDSLNLGPEDLDKILLNQALAAYTPELLTRHGRLHAVAKCQELNEGVVGFSFMLTFPRLENPYLVYSIFQTGFFAEDGKCYKLEEGGKVVIVDEIFYNFNGCPTDVFELCPENDFLLSISVSCINNWSKDCVVIESNLTEPNIVEIESGILVTSSSDVSVFDKEGHSTATYSQCTAYIKWDNMTHAVQIDDYERIFINPHHDGMNQVTLNISMDYKVHNGKFVYPLEAPDVINISLIPEMKAINNIIEDNVNKVDFKFKEVDSTLFGVSMTAYGTLLLQGIFIVVFVIVVWQCCPDWKCCPRKNPQGMTNSNVNTQV